MTTTCANCTRVLHRGVTHFPFSDFVDDDVPVADALVDMFLAGDADLLFSSLASFYKSTRLPSFCNYCMRDFKKCYRFRNAFLRRCNEGGFLRTVLNERDQSHAVLSSQTSNLDVQDGNIDSVETPRTEQNELVTHVEDLSSSPIEIEETCSMEVNEAISPGNQIVLNYCENENDLKAELSSFEDDPLTVEPDLAGMIPHPDVGDTEKQQRTRKLHPCALCRKKFRFRAFLLVHIQIDHSEGEEPSTKLECNFCSAKYTTRIAMTRHVFTHTGEQTYTCTLENCKYYTTRLDYLNLHQKKMHNVEQDTDLADEQMSSTFRCKFADCKEEFQFQAHLLSHVTQHFSNHTTNQNASLSCRFCDFSSFFVETLNEHMFFHTAETNGVTTNSGKLFATVDGHGIHLKEDSSLGITSGKPTYVAVGNLFHCIVCGKSSTLKHLHQVHFVTHTPRPSVPL